MLTDSKKCLSFLPVLSSHCLEQFQCQEHPHKFTFSSLPLTKDKRHVFICLQGTQGSFAAPFCGALGCRAVNRQDSHYGKASQPTL